MWGVSINKVVLNFEKCERIKHLPGLEERQAGLDLPSSDV